MGEEKMVLKWAVKREIEVEHELLVREVGECLVSYATIDDLRRACEAAGLVVADAEAAETASNVVEFAAFNVKGNHAGSRAAWAAVVDEFDALTKSRDEAVDQRDEARKDYHAAVDRALEAHRVLEAAKRVVAERDAAEAERLVCLDALAEHVSPDGTVTTLRMVRPSSVLAGIRALQGRLRDARSDYREHDAALEAAVERAEKAEARLARLRTIGVSVSDDGTIVDVRDDLRARLETAESQLSLRVQVGDIVVRNSADASKVEALRERIRELEADLAAARARIAELEAPMPEATVEELHAAYCAEATVHAGIRAVAERVRRERCIIARAVAANIDVRVAEDHGGGFLVAAHRAGEDEDVERNVPAAEVRDELARMLTEVGA